ncbi:MAG: sugar transferase [Bacteroidales bacterium]|nr:sugar transferase [Bacteroidales bacterium]MCF8351787.1 sugar transferase [Bacteroidales bacterium]MCF8377355.1 sugar transferase [Bacteroidales bacterium]MCF8401384.1 sugar transferase [Bacteroidales bacterium]
MGKRIFDIFFAALGLLILFPLFLFLSIWIVLDSRGGVFYRQRRVGKNNRDFFLYKFRTMRPGSDSKGLITVGFRDPRVTRAGYFIRKYKLDELPQLINILKGDMSFVGPRPEVRKYVDLYDEEQLKVLQVRPGLTDYASLEYINESELLARSPDPDKTYIEEIMPAKLELNKKYIRGKSFTTDLNILWKTIYKIFH